MHLNISQPSLIDSNCEKCWAKIQFDVSWEGAWKNDINCDGVWLFIKYRIADGMWKHATHKQTNDLPFDYLDHTPPGFSLGHEKNDVEMGMWVPGTHKGVFIFIRKNNCNVQLKGVQILWDYPADGIHAKDLACVEIQCFGLEMVYVPCGDFFVGDPEGTNGPENCLYTYPNNGAYQVTSENEITVDSVDGALYCDKDNIYSRDDIPFVIPKMFPKGYKAFWCMKYELTTQQYVDFLNTLTRKQQNSRTESDISTDVIENYFVMTNTKTEHLRQSIVCEKNGNSTDKPISFYTYAPFRACSGISWGDIAAYAAWAALRPITEMEYEKACRGTAQPISSEFAWGTRDIGRVDSFSGPDGSGRETKIPTKRLVNCCYGGGIAPYHKKDWKEPQNPGFEGPVSCGLFANSQHLGISRRENDGATFYGIMEMSGNLWGPCVTLGHQKGRAYTGLHGDGLLDENGDATVPDWPGNDCEGTGMRGGTWESDSIYLTVAIREVASFPRPFRRIKGGCRLGF